MRHQRAGKKLNRPKKERQALFKNLISGLVTHGQIRTTEAKAKAIKGLVDRLVGQAKKGPLGARRNLLAFFQDKKIVNKLVDQIAPKFGSRNSGFTRIIKLGQRLGDGAMMVRIEFVEFAPETEQTPKKRPARSRKTRVTPKKNKTKTV